MEGGRERTESLTRVVVVAAMDTARLEGVAQAGRADLADRGGRCRHKLSGERGIVAAMDA